MSTFVLSDAHRAVLLQQDWFAALPQEVRDQVPARARRIMLASGEVLYEHGDMADGFYIVLEGCIRISSVSLEGHETVLDFFDPGFWFGEVAALDGGPRTYGATAYGPSLVLHLGQRALEDLLSTSREFARALLRLEASRLRILLEAIESYSVQTLEQRLANRLLMLAGRYGAPQADGGIAIDLRLSQETLARLIGSTRQRVNQILQEWHERRLVEHFTGHVVIRDKRALEDLARL